MTRRTAIAGHPSLLEAWVLRLVASVRSTLRLRGAWREFKLRPIPMGSSPLVLGPLQRLRSPPMGQHHHHQRPRRTLPLPPPRVPQLRPPLPINQLPPLWHQHQDQQLLPTLPARLLLRSSLHRQLRTRMFLQVTVVCRLTVDRCTCAKWATVAKRTRISTGYDTITSIRDHTV